MRRLRDEVVPMLEQMAAGAEIDPAGRERLWALFDLLTRESLSLPAGGSAAPFSGIDNDGTPFQLCVTLGQGASGVRYLTEIGVPGSSLAERNRLTRERMAAVMEWIGGGTEATETLAALYPLAPEVAPREPAAGYWVAVAHDPNGVRLRLYANNGWGPEIDRWERLAQALARLGASGFALRLRELLPLLASSFSPAGLAVTVPGPAILKLYLRPKGDPWRSSSALLARVASGGAALAAELDAGLGGTPAALGGRALLPSLAMRADGGAWDVKLDLCGHCLFPAGTNAPGCVAALALRLGLDATPYRRSLGVLSSGLSPARIDDLHAFLGVGSHPEKGRRLNIYLKPRPAPAATRSRSRPRPAAGDRVRRAMASGLAALLDAQEEGGLWSDFRLPVGLSTWWVTAWVAGACLEAAAASGLQNRARAAVRRAAAALLAGVGDGGWGFNAGTEPDADTTALSCLLLARTLGVPRSLRTALARHRNPDGGYATFRRSDPADSWGESHADVTPTVLRTLWLPPGAAARDTLLQPVVRARCAAGHWSSYWWRSDLYATEASLRALAWAGRSDACSASRDWLLAGPTPETAFERALHLRALSHLPEVPLEALRRGLSDLLAEQLPDGTFHPGAWLRVTDPACSAPWAASSGGGRLYLDDGLFTTATAVAALAVWAPRIPNR